MESPSSMGSDSFDNYGRNEVRCSAKRKAHLSDNDHTNHETVASHLAEHIEQGLKTPIVNETIHLCGAATLAILAYNPDEVLELAHNKLHAWSFRDVPTCWPRLYEDASLRKAAMLLRSEVQSQEKVSDRNKKTKLPNSELTATFLTDLVTILDMGFTLSGAPGRRDLFISSFDLLGHFVSQDCFPDVPSQFRISSPPRFQTDSAVPSSRALDFERFQDHLDSRTTPLRMTDAINSWPALHRWKDPAHLLTLTLGGRRLVPVEIGESYTDDDWSQKVMSIEDYLRRYILPEQPTEMGYLAQHDLLTQIPALRKDILTPDYCFTSPPNSVLATSHATQLDEPMVNAWFGPKGTRSPIHTDPYHNIFCQVVGYKYVRVYSPNEADKLYPKGVDESGINMGNTSTVDFAFSKRLDDQSLKSTFPKFHAADFQEVILAPGDCLYIPAGWWHFVESLSTSFSVSFWWN